MRHTFFVWPLIFLLALGIGWAQQGENKQKEGEKAPPSATAGDQEVAPPHGFRKFTPEEIAKKNTQKFTTVSVARGKKIYDTQCAMCHGEKGDGKGDLAAEMPVKMPDFTNPATLEKRTDGELFALIGSGSPDMPGQGSRLKDHHKWQLVNYLRSLSGKVPEKSKGNEPEEGILLIPQ